jgi:hypothetical protein
MKKKNNSNAIDSDASLLEINIFLSSDEHIQIFHTVADCNAFPLYTPGL